MLGEPYCGYILNYYGYPLDAPMEKVALARNCRAQNDPGTAAELFKQALDPGMGTPDKQAAIRLELAECLNSMKMSDEAQAQYGIAIEEAPLNPLCYGKRGLFHYNASRDSDAESDFKRAIELADDRSRYIFHLGRLYAVSGRPEEGLALLDPAIEENPYSVGLFHSRALCRLKLGMDEGAKDDFRRADFLGHRTAQADRRQAYGDEDAMDFFSAGIEAGERNDFAHAAEHFARAGEMFRPQSLHPGDLAWRYTAKSLHNLGYYRHQKGELKEALDSIEQALEMTPHYKDAWISLGNVHDTMGNPADALECYNRAIELQPNDGRGYYSRGRILMAQKRFDEGAEDFSRAANFYGRNDWKGDAFFNRAKCHEGAGRIRQAMDDYQQAFSHGIQQGMYESVRLREAHGIE
jgi:tetratricopeptide (TPR) repeat protein